jgi:hypothetical protein
MIGGIFKTLLQDAFRPKTLQLSSGIEKKIKDVEEITTDDAIFEFVQESVDIIEDIETKVSESMQSAVDAKKQAEYANRDQVGFFNKGEIITRLQGATRDIGKAVAVSAETQLLLFKHQCILADVCKKLFEIGIRNIDTTQKTIYAIEMRLKGASEEEISELARTELLNVVRQLKSQEDIYFKHQWISEKVKGLETTINGLSDTQKKVISAQKSIENDVGEKTKAYVEKIESLENKIAQMPESKNLSTKLAVVSMVCSLIAIVLSVVF